ncbi:MAG: hypothetical protein O3B13_18325 [Planctomycetota bacterium]|nr:hypothetical protein [Planctomycetota bacterium]
MILDALANAPTDGNELSPLAKHLSNDKLSREDPGYVLRQFIVDADDESDQTASLTGSKEFHQRWQVLKKDYSDEQTRRAASNAANFEVWSDFQEQGLFGWSTDGLGLAGGPKRCGEFLLTHKGDQIVAAVLPAGLYTNITSERES